MMSIKELFENLKSDFDLIPIAHLSHINQNGEYVILSGFGRENPNTKTLNLKVIFARNTYDKEVYAGLDKIEEFENKIFKKIEAKFRATILNDMQIRDITESLYVYIFDLRIPMKKVY